MMTTDGQYHRKLEFRADAVGPGLRLELGPASLLHGSIEQAPEKRTNHRNYSDKLMRSRFNPYLLKGYRCLLRF